MLKINDIKMPAPSNYQVRQIDLDNLMRNARGQMIRERIATKREIELEWTLITPEETSLILKAIKPEFVKVEYFDQEDNTWRTGIFYASEKSNSALTFKNGRPIWKGLKFSLIER
ncbi:DUF6711 family protein [Tissierellaceae bacterium HCP3S3_D8]